MTNWLTRRIQHAMPKGGAKEVGLIMWDSWKMILISLCLMNVGFISVVTCGRLGKLELDGVSLAVSTINVIGMSMAWGVGSAFDTFFSQAFGSPNKKQVSVYLQTGLIFSSFVCLFCITVYVSSYDILVFLHQDPGVARVVEEYVFYFAPGLPCGVMFMIIGKYLQAQKYTNQPLVCEICGCILNITLQYVLVHVLDLGVRITSLGTNQHLICEMYGCILNIILQYVLVHVLDLGVRGSAIAHAAGYAFMLVLIIAYLLISGVYKATWTAWSLDCLEEWGKLSKLAISSLCLVCIDWWGIEIGLFLIGTLGVVPLGANGIIFQIMTLIFAMAQGVAQKWVYTIGRCLGQGDADSARRYCNAAILLAFSLSLFLFLGMVALMTVIPPVFTHSREIAQLATYLFPIGALFHFVDDLKSMLSGVIRGMGGQFKAAVVSFVTLTIIAFGMAFPLTLYTNLGSLGYWTGAITGGGLCAISFLYILYNTDWEHEVEQTAARIKKRQAIEKQEITESMALLAKGGPVRRRNLCYLLTTRLLIALPFLVAFVVSVTFRVISPPYSTSVPHFNDTL